MNVGAQTFYATRKPYRLLQVHEMGFPFTMVPFCLRGGNKEPSFFTPRCAILIDGVGILRERLLFVLGRNAPSVVGHAPGN